MRKLEEKFSRELVVIGVHSAKFTTEKQNENVRLAVLRHELHHPVINDRDFKVWNQYGIQAWPTLVLIDPLGMVVGRQPGEQVLEVFDPVISQMVTDFDRANLIDRKLLEFQKETRPAGDLAFPGKIEADPKGGRLFISDTNHNRVIVTDETGQVTAVIGSGEAGLNNGSFEQARFDKPQGLELVGDVLYIADTENHAIRAANLKERTVATLAGNGRKGYPNTLPARGEAAPLNSPWDLAYANGKLYVAMAGTHQLWAVDLATREVEVHAGSGREGLLDSSLTSASLAQPSGLTTNGQQLFFADAEVSAIRMASLGDEGRVETIVGQDLFVFGDVDGVGDVVRLQHPLGVCWFNGHVYVADAYNHKIKRIDPAKRECRTVLGNGTMGSAAGQLSEPGGVTAANGKLYIADSNNHRIQVYDLSNGTVTTLILKGLK